MSKSSSEFVAEYRGIAESSDTLIKADDQTLYREMCWRCNRVFASTPSKKGNRQNDP